MSATCITQGEVTKTYIIFVGISHMVNTSVRPSSRWKDNIKTDLKEVVCEHFKLIPPAQAHCTPWFQYQNRWSLQRVANLVFLSFIRLWCCSVSTWESTRRHNPECRTVSTLNRILIHSLVYSFFLTFFCPFFLAMPIVYFPFFTSYQTEVFTCLSTRILQRFLPTLCITHIIILSGQPKLGDSCNWYSVVK
jgi:hypothetical protein